MQDYCSYSCFSLSGHCGILSATGDEKPVSYTHLVDIILKNTLNMKQITLHVYQSIDGCPAPSDKYFDAAVRHNQSLFCRNRPTQMVHINTQVSFSSISTQLEASTAASKYLSESTRCV